MKADNNNLLKRLFNRNSAGEEVLELMLRARSEYIQSYEDDSSMRSQYFTSRLMSRIKEMRENGEFSPWENYVASSRGWLLALGIVACLMLVPSLLELASQPPRPASETGLEVLALTTGDGAIQVLEDLPTEETANGHKQ